MRGFPFVSLICVTLFVVCLGFSRCFGVVILSFDFAYLLWFLFSSVWVIVLIFGFLLSRVGLVVDFVCFYFGFLVLYVMLIYFWFVFIVCCLIRWRVCYWFCSYAAILLWTLWSGGYVVLLQYMFCVLFWFVFVLMMFKFYCEVVLTVFTWFGLNCVYVVCYMILI